MITTTRSPIRAPLAPIQRQAGFTLAEVLIASTIGAFILAAVLSAFLFLGRSGANIQNYNDMESQARDALEQFAQDTRQASAVTWNSNSSLTLVVESAAITYVYNASNGTFSRVTGSGSTLNQRQLVTGITSFTFLAYTITGTQISDFSTAAARLVASNTTKQIQISLAASRASQTVVNATNTVLSARFILRNKHVTT